MAFLSTFLFKIKKSKIKIPYFIGLFIVAMVLNSYVPLIQQYGHYLVRIAKAELFLIGCGLSKKVLQSVGLMPLLQALILWVVISLTALWAVASVVT